MLRLKIIGLGLLVLTAGVVGLVGYAAVTADSQLLFPAAAMPEFNAGTDPGLIEQGRYLVHGPAHCSQCHSTSNRNRPEDSLTSPLSGGLKFSMGPMGTRYARNLTPDPETGIGKISDAALARTLRTAVMHDGELSFFMFYAAAILAEKDIGAVISYLRSLSPVRNLVPPGKWAILGKVLLTYVFPPLGPRATTAPMHVTAGAGPTVKRGRYLVENVMLCTSCHSQFNKMTLSYVGPRGGGGLPDPSHGDDAEMEFVAPNLTTHPTGVTGKLDEDTFVARIRAGRVYRSSIMPWESFGKTTEDDLRSVYRYLRTLPPVDNDVGPTYRLAGWQPTLPGHSASWSGTVASLSSSIDSSTHFDCIPVASAASRDKTACETGRALQ